MVNTKFIFVYMLQKYGLSSQMGTYLPQRRDSEQLLNEHKYYLIA